MPKQPPPTVAKATWYNPSANNEPVPVGGFLFATAIAAFPGQGFSFNRDMLPGPEKPTDPPWVWGARVTLPGSNGYFHQKDWAQFHESHGEACFTISNVGENCTVTFVRVESIEIAKAKGPDAYGPSR